MNNSSNPSRPLSVLRRHCAGPREVAGAVGAILAAALLMGTDAAAQTAPAASTPPASSKPAPAKSTASQGPLEEIVVTARYHEEPLQTTPIAITAINAEDI